MVKRHFSDIDTWVFDLDNTLYPPSARLFDQIERRMTDWVMRTLGVDHSQADELRARYWREHGTTLAGLMHNHGIDPWDFLMDVHDIDMTVLQAAPDLARAIAALPGRRIVYTNADTVYAARVLAARGLAEVFDAVYGIEHAGWHPKPDRAAFDTVFAADGVAPDSAAMFEDDARNLTEPHAMGMRTVHVTPDPSPARPVHIHHQTDDLTGFLIRLTDGVFPDGPERLS